MKFKVQTYFTLSLTGSLSVADTDKTISTGKLVYFLE